MNITVHSEFRYATRILKEHLDKNEDQFRKFIALKENEEYKQKIDALISAEYQESIYLACDSFGKYDKTHFYLNKETLNILVVDLEKISILSCFRVDFDLSEVGTKGMLDILLLEWEIHKEELSQNKDNLENEKLHLKDKIKYKSDEIQQLKERITLLEDSTHTLKNNLHNIDKEIETLDYNVKNTLSKIIYSFAYKKEVLMR